MEHCHFKNYAVIENRKTNVLHVPTAYEGESCENFFSYKALVVYYLKSNEAQHASQHSL